MRKMEYLSPTSIKAYGDNIDDFYIRYLSEDRPPRPPQTQPMSIGSAFDAYVKSYLHETFYGKGADPQYELVALFEAQVEPHNREWAWEHGKHAFELYRNSGALADLALELDGAIGKPRFEMELKGLVAHPDPVTNTICDVVFLGKPDLFFINKEGHFVILDWKVNGWCSKSGASPKKGYLHLRHDDRTVVGAHKDAIPMMHQGMMINVAHNLEDVEKDWAAQLAVYGWLCGAEIGEEFIVCIDQLACKLEPGKQFPRVRFAQHRTRVGKSFQQEYFAKAHYLWQLVQTDHIFRHMTREESIKHSYTLDQKAKTIKEMYESGNYEDKLFMEFTN
jgi:hypothetical protein